VHKRIFYTFAANAGDMVERQICAKIVFCLLQELPEEEKKLVEVAKKCSENAYAPYSGFKVGAACLLENGEVGIGCNQENAAYPAGICAERTALFHASSVWPDSPVLVLAVAAQNATGFVSDPVAPCGICRQVLLEVEQRFGKPVKVILYGSSEIAVFEKATDLLPMSFGARFL
jgi:cytidine deaminase